MPGGRKLATSRLSWLAKIPTCLAKIGILVPALGTVVWGNFASKARHDGSRRGYRQPAAHGRLLRAGDQVTALGGTRGTPRSHRWHGALRARAGMG
jgi:hypothetical protein